MLRARLKILDAGWLVRGIMTQNIEADCDATKLMYDDLISTLCEIENRVDTQSLTYGDVNYWPLCRLKLWSHLTKEGFRSTSNQSDRIISNSEPTLPDVSEIKATPFGDPKSSLLTVSSESAETMIEMGALSPEILFFLRPEEYRDTVRGAAFAKILDSAYERADNHRRLKVELADPRIMGFERLYPSAFFQLAATNQNSNFDPPGKPKNFESLSRVLQELNITDVIRSDQITFDMVKIFYFARLFEVLLKHLEPKLVILSVYYHPVGMALMLAANRLGIPTVDVQHGRLGPHHGLYTQMTAAPAEGYAIVPDTIWCWGAQTKHDIDVDKNPDCPRHGGLVGGNPWLDRWRHASVALEANENMNSLLAVSAKKKKILVSMQPLAKPLPDFVISAIANCPKDWTWWLRLHPLRRHTADQLKQLLSEKGIHNVEIDDPTNLPLFSLLRSCDHHVTAFSSVAVEALAFGIRTTIVNKIGLKVFQRYIDQGLMNSADTPDTLISATLQSIESPPPIDEKPFIDPKPGLAEAALVSLLAYQV